MIHHYCQHWLGVNVHPYEKDAQVNPPTICTKYKQNVIHKNFQPGTGGEKFFKGGIWLVSAGFFCCNELGSVSEGLCTFEFLLSQEPVRQLALNGIDLSWVKHPNSRNMCKSTNQPLD